MADVLQWVVIVILVVAFIAVISSRFRGVRYGEHERRGGPTAVTSGRQRRSWRSSGGMARLNAREPAVPPVEPRLVALA